MLWNVFTPEKFAFAPERFVAKRLSETYQNTYRLSLFVASNLVMDKNLWFTDLETEGCRERYLEARRIVLAPEHHLGSRVVPFLEINAVSGSVEPSSTLNSMLAGEITPEEVILLDRASPFLANVGCSNFLIEEVIRRLDRYRPFVTVQNENTLNSLKNLIQRKIENDKSSLSTEN
jgi:hypothetical protein